MNKRVYVFLFKLFLAVVVSAAAAYVWSLPEIAWAPLVALFMIPTQIGAVLRDGVISYLIVVLSFIFGSLLKMWVPLWLLVCIYFFVGIAVSRWLDRKQALYILIILLITFLVPVSMPLMTSRLFGITLGAGVGILINLMVFPPKIEKEFRAVIVPLLEAYSSYFAEIIKLSLSKENSADMAKKNVEKAWLQMPDWVYQAGLSIAFQAGHRHFAIRVEQVGEILFAEHYLARTPIEKELANKVEQPLLQCVARVQQMFAAFIQVLYLHQLSQGLEDFLQDIEAVEMQINNISEDTHLAAFVYQLKDLRFVMMKMAEALR